MTSEHPVQKRIARHKSGDPVGIYSVCSANRMVLQAAMARAGRDRSSLLIEATCNQVNQFGGYTGMSPHDFYRFVRELALKEQFPKERLILGGDHLGPSVWQGQDSETAMEKARELIRAYVDAGFTKIHLDASMSCADDPIPLSDPIVAERAANLCREAESVRPAGTALVYVIGTEVPTPGGAQEEMEALSVTSPAEAEETIANSRAAFQAAGLEGAWERVVALVVQPGVEFGSHEVVDYLPEEARELSRLVEDYPHLAYEAHSTDYQREEALRRLVRDHFAILKVGPWLTFALREGVFSLALIEEELAASHGTPRFEPSRIRETLDRAMLANPGYWKKYYPGSPESQAFERKYSFSDRIRYYWNQEEVEDSLQRLISNLSSREIPLTLVSQYFPAEFQKVRDGSLSADPDLLLRARVESVLGIYARACGLADRD